MANAFNSPPQPEHVIIRRPRDDRSLWIVLGLVAVVAIVALVFVFSQGNSVHQQALADQAALTQQSVDTAGQASSMADQAARSASMAAGAASNAATTATRNAAANAAANADRATGAADQTAAASPPAPANGAASQQ